ncbi:uncharacterized protein E0L32_008311 [Thyridium curvatum]|uniref:Uncharacterized protein n=1 Tax=Thyridium curvatum TaxID=1093900 RepID=A0A507ALW0_9PEZI|nr:uncharacterized protein E0L32_008311 [Thyridium curvatum]TPX10742.1 hypothetical protein E0L32_008311 [Thyridium curvatum]
MSSPKSSRPRPLSEVPFLTLGRSTAASSLDGNFSLSLRSPALLSHDAAVRKEGHSRGARVAFSPASPAFSHHQAPRLLDNPGLRASCDSEQSGPDRRFDDAILSPFSVGTAPGEVAAEGREEGKLGTVSVINIIVGKTIGVGVYSVQSAIFAGVGSVGMSLLLWVLGSVISFCGLAVYLDLGTAMPKSGGERVYLERMIQRPRMLATCMFMSYVVLLGFSAPNAIVLGEYLLSGLDIEPGRWYVRGIAVLVVSAACYLHAYHPKFGLRTINVLGVSKMLVLFIVIISGIVGASAGVGSNQGSAQRYRRGDANVPVTVPDSTAARNFQNIWSGSSTQPYDYATALLKVIYCFRGFSTANQVLSDVRDPTRTLKIAAPIALTIVSLAYLVVSIVFFLVIDKDDFQSGGVILASVFFRNVFGPGFAAHILPFCIIVSAAGNIAATSFAQARVNEELAKDGLLPWSDFWIRGVKSSMWSRAKDKEAEGSDSETHGSTSGPPRGGLLLHWLVSVLVIIVPPPGRIYNFLVDIGGYPVSVISVAISVGLLWLYRSNASWVSPCPAPTFAIVIFAVSNLMLLILPWLPPTSGRSEDGRLPYYAYPTTALAVLGSGALYWCWWRLKPGRDAVRHQGQAWEASRNEDSIDGATIGLLDERRGREE